HPGKCRCEPDPSTRKHGMLAVLEFRSPGGRGPSIMDEVFTRPVQDAIRAAIDANPAVAHLRKLQSQLTDSQKVKRLATAKIAHLEGKGTALSIEVPDGLAKKLAALDSQIAAQREQLDAAETDLATLQPLVDKVLADTESIVETKWYATTAQAKGDIAAK